MILKCIQCQCRQTILPLITRSIFGQEPQKNRNLVRNISLLSLRLLPIKIIQNPSTSFLGKVKDKLIWNLFTKQKMLRASHVLYTGCTDGIDTLHFIKEFNLPDTFFSWFLVTELHIWMCQVRLAKEGDGGRFMRNNMMNALWKDVDIRLKKLGEISGGVKSEGRDKLLEHYQAALISYDEGLLADDRTLAGAVWRIFFTYQCDNAYDIERIVHYIRVQISNLEAMPTNQVTIEGKVAWVPFDKVSNP